MTATKEQERKALAQIQSIVESLGEGSYIGTAFAGCFEVAKSNIDNDWACSLQERAISADNVNCELKKELAATEARRDKALEEVKELQGKVEELNGKVRELKRDLDFELGWHDGKGGTNMKQKDYNALCEAVFAAKLLDEAAAKQLIHDTFGFAKDRITLVSTVETFETNKYGVTRVKQRYDRSPYYQSSDWNYIRFDCAGRAYEMVDGELYKYEN